MSVGNWKSVVAEGIMFVGDMGGAAWGRFCGLHGVWALSLKAVGESLRICPPPPHSPPRKSYQKRGHLFTEGTGGDQRAVDLLQGLCNVSVMVFPLREFYILTLLVLFQLLRNWLCKSRWACWLNYLKIACYFQHFIFPQTVDGEALEGFRCAHTRLTFGKHISVSILKQKFIVMFLTLILNPAFSACLTVFEGGGEMDCVCAFMVVVVGLWW